MAAPLALNRYQRGAMSLPLILHRERYTVHRAVATTDHPPSEATAWQADHRVTRSVGIIMEFPEGQPIRWRTTRAVVVLWKGGPQNARNFAYSMRTTCRVASLFANSRLNDSGINDPGYNRSLITSHRSPGNQGSRPWRRSWAGPPCRLGPRRGRRSGRSSRRGSRCRSSGRRSRSSWC